jgi:hypothetical protein
MAYIVDLWEKLAIENPDTLVYYKHNQAGACNLLSGGEQGAMIALD